MNITPFVTSSKSWQIPNEEYYDSPVYDMSTDDDDNLINPGEVLYYVPTRTGQKDQHGFNYGISATFSMPLDGSLQARCKKSVDSHIAMRNQLVANKRLDFELARLKNCGNLMKEGIRFHPRSKFAIICSDIMLTPIPGKVVPHTHSISSPSTSSKNPSSKEVTPSSHDNDQQLSQPESDDKESDQASSGWLRWPFSRQASPPSEEGPPAALLGGPMSLPPRQ